MQLKSVSTTPFFIAQNFKGSTFRSASYISSLYGVVSNCEKPAFNLTIKSQTKPTAALFENFEAYLNGQKSTIETDCKRVVPPTAIPTCDFVMNAFPNPTISKIVLSVCEEHIGKELQVYNVIGQVVMSNTVLSNLQTIDMTNLASGMYLFRIGENTIKVVKE